MGSQIPSTVTSQPFHRSTGTQCTEVVSESELVRQLLIRCGFSLFNCPLSWYSNFKESDVDVQMVSPDSVLEFFNTFGLSDSRCTIPSLPEDIVQTPIQDNNSLCQLLKYCTKACDYKEKLVGLPLLVTVDKKLRTFDKSEPKFVTWHSAVMPHVPDMFIDTSLHVALALKPESDTNICKCSPFKILLIYCQRFFKKNRFAVNTTLFH